MKFVGALFYCVLLHLVMQINGNKDILVEEESSQHVTTIIGAVNVTFTWKIKNYHLINWRLKQNPETIFGPTLTAKDGKKVQCKIDPFKDGKRLQESIHEFNDRATPKLVCKFNPQPFGINYSYEHDGGIITNDTTLDRIHGDEIKIIIDAFYA